MADNNWYTPGYVIDSARAVLGGSIELDPASCSEANQVVKADRYYTIEDDGLSLPWDAHSVWLNPPFAASVSCAKPQYVWGSRLIHAYQRGHVEQALLLIMAATKQKWFHDLWAMHPTAPICFSRKRLHFTRPGNSPQELRESTCFLYLGPNETAFVDTFSAYGTVAKRVSPPPSRVETPALITIGGGGYYG